MISESKLRISISNKFPFKKSFPIDWWVAFKITFFVYWISLYFSYIFLDFFQIFKPWSVKALPNSESWPIRCKWFLSFMTLYFHLQLFQIVSLQDQRGHELHRSGGKGSRSHEWRSLGTTRLTDAGIGELHLHLRAFPRSDGYDVEAHVLWESEKLETCI